MHAQYPGGPPLLNKHSLYGGGIKSAKKTSYTFTPYTNPPNPPQVSEEYGTIPRYVACVLRLKFRKRGVMSDEVSIIEKDVSAPFLIQVESFKISQEELNSRLEKYFDFCWSDTESDAADDNIKIESIKEFVKDAVFDEKETELDFTKGLEEGNLKPRRVMAQFPSEYYIIESQKRYFKENPICRNVSHIFYPVFINKDYMSEEKHFNYRLFFSHIQFVNSFQNGFFSTESISLDKCFKYFSENEVLDSRNQWFCKHCQKNVNANKKMDIWSAPKILIIQLKRFVSGDDYIKKLDANVNYPDEFDLSEYLVGPDKNRKCMYKLFAVCEHFGSLMGGHYTAHALVSPSTTSNINKKNVNNYENAKWYHFNDSSAKKSSTRDAHSHNAYMLFYEKIE